MEEFILWEMLINLFSFHIILSFQPSIFYSALSSDIWIWLTYYTNKIRKKIKMLQQKLFVPGSHIQTQMSNLFAKCCKRRAKLRFYVFLAQE